MKCARCGLDNCPVNHKAHFESGQGDQCLNHLCTRLAEAEKRVVEVEGIMADLLTQNVRVIDKCAEVEKRAERLAHEKVEAQDAAEMWESARNSEQRKRSEVELREQALLGVIRSRVRSIGNNYYWVDTQAPVGSLFHHGLKAYDEKRESQKE